ncbi:hypothetical protein [Dyadobacter sp. Leaf189]|uniref:hypothetical protein n=1 Tax=Dyadobacter sp. Leaf189 TaxID=1736295 RepID=UPI0006F2ADA9|nr:hypothetical protein [Dyadobacter sp. Leaf189]KQS24657.1 hypothetical protein ASG33_23105 [Dyadobacter sp. Leaf189]
MQSRLPTSDLSLRSVDELEKEIHERKLVEQKLAKSEFLLSEEGRIAREGGWELDVETKQSSWSKVSGAHNAQVVYKTQYILT